MIATTPTDTPASIRRDIEIIKQELPIDILEFFCLTPLPGSEDHKKMLEAGEWMDPDLNKYNLHHRVSRHPRMSDEEWEAAYRDCWRLWFNDEHMETVARRHAVRAGGRPAKAVQYMNEFKMLWEIEGLHAMEGGVLRRKRRSSRRPGFRREPPVWFELKYALETAGKAWRYWRMYRNAARIVRKVESDPGRYAYADIAITPVSEEEIETLDLFHETAGGEAFVEKKRRQDAILAGEGSIGQGYPVDPDAMDRYRRATGHEPAVVHLFRNWTDATGTFRLPLEQVPTAAFNVFFVTAEEMKTNIISVVPSPS